MSVDQASFDEAMEAQRARGRAATSFSTSLGQKISVKEKVQFCGYEQLANKASVLAVFDAEGEPLEQLDADQSQGVIVLDQTAFYAESGGQVGDTQISGDQFLHIGGLLEGTIRAGDILHAEVDTAMRNQTRANHSATPVSYTHLTLPTSRSV